MAYADTIRTTDYTREELANLIDGNRFVGEAVFTAGTEPNYTVTLTPAPSAYFQGMTVIARPHASNTSGPAYLDVNGLGAKLIRVRALTGTGSRNLYLGELNIGHPCIFVYDGASFILANPAGGYVVDNSLVPFTTGTRPNYELTTNIKEVGTLDGRTVRFRCHSTFNGGTATLNVNGTGARNIVVKQYSTVERGLLNGELAYGGVYKVTYEDGEWQLTNPSYSAGVVAYTPSVSSSGGTLTLLGSDVWYTYLNARAIRVHVEANFSLLGTQSADIYISLPTTFGGEDFNTFGVGYVAGAAGYADYGCRVFVSSSGMVFRRDDQTPWQIDGSFTLYATVIYNQG